MREKLSAQEKKELIPYQQISYWLKQKANSEAASGSVPHEATIAALSHYDAEIAAICKKYGLDRKKAEAEGEALLEAERTGKEYVPQKKKESSQVKDGRPNMLLSKEHTDRIAQAKAQILKRSQEALRLEIALEMLNGANPEDIKTRLNEIRREVKDICDDAGLTVEEMTSLFRSSWSEAQIGTKSLAEKPIGGEIPMRNEQKELVSYSEGKNEKFTGPEKTSFVIPENAERKRKWWGGKESDKDLAKRLQKEQEQTIKDVESKIAGYEKWSKLVQEQPKQATDHGMVFLAENAKEDALRKMFNTGIDNPGFYARLGVNPADVAGMKKQHEEDKKNLEQDKKWEKEKEKSIWKKIVIGATAIAALWSTTLNDQKRTANKEKAPQKIEKENTTRTPQSLPGTTDTEAFTKAHVHATTERQHKNPAKETTLQKEFIADLTPAEKVPLAIPIEEQATQRTIVDTTNINDVISKIQLPTSDRVAIPFGPVQDIETMPVNPTTPAPVVMMKDTIEATTIKPISTERLGNFIGKLDREEREKSSREVKKKKNIEIAPTRVKKVEAVTNIENIKPTTIAEGLIKDAPATPTAPAKETKPAEKPAVSPTLEKTKEAPENNREVPKMTIPEGLEKDKAAANPEHIEITPDKSAPAMSVWAPGAGPVKEIKRVTQSDYDPESSTPIAEDEAEGKAIREAKKAYDKRNTFPGVDVPWPVPTKRRANETGPVSGRLENISVIPTEKPILDTVIKPVKVIMNPGAEGMFNEQPDTVMETDNTGQTHRIEGIGPREKMKPMSTDPIESLDNKKVRMEGGDSLWSILAYHVDENAWHTIAVKYHDQEAKRTYLKQVEQNENIGPWGIGLKSKGVTLLFDENNRLVTEIPFGFGKSSGDSLNTYTTTGNREGMTTPAGVYFLQYADSKTKKELPDFGHSKEKDLWLMGKMNPDGTVINQGIAFHGETNNDIEDQEAGIHSKDADAHHLSIGCIRVDKEALAWVKKTLQGRSVYKFYILSEDGAMSLDPETGKLGKVTEKERERIIKQGVDKYRLDHKINLIAITDEREVTKDEKTGVPIANQIITRIPDPGAPARIIPEQKNIQIKVPRFIKNAR